MTARALEKYIGELCSGRGGALVAFSGGVDSALVLRAALEGAPAALAVTARHALSRPGEAEEAREAALSMGAEHVFAEIDVMALPEVRHNGRERCYLCKRAIFAEIKRIASERGYAVLDGTNASDLRELRPGRRALAELGIRSPLAELGIEKDAVRALAAEYGLGVSAKPSSPCMATRFPYGAELTAETLARAAAAEELLKKMGFPVCRARTYDAGGAALARIEVPAERFADMLPRFGDVSEGLKRLGYTYVALDMEGLRSGSMDEALRAVDS